MLTGKLALVTGASSGIGYQAAKIFAQQGATLVLADVKNNFGNLLNEIKGETKHLTQICDVSSSKDVNNMFQKIKETYPQHLVPSIVLNSAGVADMKEFHTMTEEDFDRVINVNLKGSFLVTQAAIRGLVDNYKNVKLLPGQSYASIIHLASIIGKYGFPTHSHYAASKAGLEGLTKSISREFGKYQIRCNAILPGYIDTPMTEPLPERNRDRLIRTIPLGRMGRPEEVGQLCLFLASDLSSYINGASIDCNGGLVL
jgi:NAD(P)-dependent dehydrogenase (short-subunit alcohol dehydrogenase family)